MIEVAELAVETRVGSGGLVHPAITWRRISEWWNGATVRLERTEDLTGGWTPVSGSTSSSTTGGVTTIEVEDAGALPGTDPRGRARRFTE